MVKVEMIPNAHCLLMKVSVWKSFLWFIVDKTVEVSVLDLI